MSIRILYFAALREALGQSEESFDLPAEAISLGQLRQTLAARDGNWQTLNTMKNLKAAINQTMAGAEVLLQDGDEVAFFPPVTGG
ncbi:MAG TPA: molybdopterin converting factor subunit 1 [Rhodocyclaceae bacterium]|jgi:molybdopterin synthase sulfur carrier subunit